MEEIHQMKVDKTKKKGNHHDPEHVVDKEETPVRHGPHIAEQRFINMAKVAELLEQESVKVPKERFMLEGLLIHWG